MVPQLMLAMLLTGSGFKAFLGIVNLDTFNIMGLTTLGIFLLIYLKLSVEKLDSMTNLSLLMLEQGLNHISSLAEEARKGCFNSNNSKILQFLSLLALILSPSNLNLLSPELRFITVI